MTTLFYGFNLMASPIDSNAIMSERYSIQENHLLTEDMDYKEIDVVLSFYTDLNCENGFGSIDAMGNTLVDGTIAIPREIPLGTQFTFEEYPNKLFIGTDRGSKKHIRITSDNVYRIDMFIPRPSGYSDSEYHEYVNNMGKLKTKGRMYGCI